ncbi:TfuA-related McrA-glycine thioamidation protein [Methanofollis ethanolicus]|uniref:TfuA-related McrA-glycine thioamidation protein n=1 Tax=Methanofollis ethanolicus TaxID=488124 RepID=UPI00082BD317|nr:TfuA-related McrA-glycine thioamidation protein [Methanofollis ethanolicus]
MPEIIVFLGPSLDREEARAILDADFRPPAARGDIRKAADEGARIIGLIDGVFFQACSVAHREVLYALRKGARVLGASSMGALRAAELDSLGMEGVGEVYQAYRDGALVSDDEVALVFDPESGTPLSEPLVNIRWTIRKAEEEGVVNAAEGTALLESARALYFPERTYEAVCDGATAAIGEEKAGQFLAFARTDGVDRKREDAVLCLRRIREIAGQG